jgi:hypothetical protein
LSPPLSCLVEISRSTDILSRVHFRVTYT